jgi:hypothetical protein
MRFSPLYIFDPLYLERYSHLWLPSCPINSLVCTILCFVTKKYYVQRIKKKISLHMYYEQQFSQMLAFHHLDCQV